MQVYSPNPQRPLSHSGLVLRNLHFACIPVGSDAMVLLPHLSNSEGRTSSSCLLIVQLTTPHLL